MKGAYVLFEKNGLLIRTQYTDTDTVKWTEGEKSVSALLSDGYQFVKTNLLNKALQELEKLRDGLCDGWEVTNTDLLEIIKMLRDY